MHTEPIGIPLGLMAPLKCCPRCATAKPATAFPTRVAGRPRPSAYCFECQRIYSREHYLRNKEKHNARRRRNQVRYIARNKRHMKDYLEGRACIDCGVSNPVVLEFDHVRGSKKLEISCMINGGFSWERILQEIAKCEIRCANCHRVKTAIQLGWNDARRDCSIDRGTARAC